jgi:hypothetical protein
MSNTIIRARRRHRFVILDQRAVEDTRLSWAARGLLAYLLSRPDDWRVLINDLRKRGDLGRDGTFDFRGPVMNRAASAGAATWSRRSLVHHIRICRIRLSQIRLHRIR